MIIPVDRDDLIKLLDAAQESNPDIVAKYDISRLPPRDLSVPGDGSELTHNYIQLNLNNVLITMTNGNGEPIKFGDSDAKPCRSHMFRVRFAGLSEEDSGKMAAYISKIELPDLDYSRNELTTVKITFYNITHPDFIKIK